MRHYPLGARIGARNTSGASLKLPLRTFNTLGPIINIVVHVGGQCTVLFDGTGVLVFAGRVLFLQVGIKVMGRGNMIST